MKKYAKLLLLSVSFLLTSNVASHARVINVDPTAFSFGPGFRGTQVLYINGTGGFTVEVPHWVHASQTRGIAPARITFTADPSKIPPNQMTVGGGGVTLTGTRTALVFYGKCDALCTGPDFMNTTQIQQKIARLREEAAKRAQP